MKKSIKSIMLIIVIGLLLINSITNVSYAQSAEDELKQVLTEYKDQIGDLKQFKEFIDEVYEVLDGETEVTQELKDNLSTSIKKLQDVEGINPLIASVLIQELEGQSNVLTNENLPEMKAEIRVMKEWVEEEIEKEESNTPPEDNNEQPPSNKPDPLPDDKEDDNNQSSNQPSNKPNNKPSGETDKDKTQSGNKLPNTGKGNIITIGMVLCAIAIISVLKYQKIKDIK